ncbi:hypothetical protein CYMTET_51276 [Cymbomonas tetramitiformis]|uniref:PH domain-containing protein n=1 Tax=Cymbomonas tetramitiformis TaxID=36881 RepID=A0AAE0BLL9_9CHLO|nr:hypothetical protein CYMTET_51276 [Cymbomonas tetramitiformis]
MEDLSDYLEGMSVAGIVYEDNKPRVLHGASEGSYLFKKSATLKKWNRRWFCLARQDDTPVLRYKQEAQDRHDKGVIRLTGSVGFGSAITSHPEWTSFYVDDGTRRTLLAAESEAEAQAWVNAILCELRSAIPPSLPQPTSVPQSDPELNSRPPQPTSYHFEALASSTSAEVSTPPVEPPSTEDAASDTGPAANAELLGSATPTLAPGTPDEDLGAGNQGGERLPEAMDITPIGITAGEIAVPTAASERQSPAPEEATHTPLATATQPSAASFTQSPAASAQRSRKSTPNSAASTSSSGLGGLMRSMSRMMNKDDTPPTRGDSATLRRTQTAAVRVDPDQKMLDAMEMWKSAIKVKEERLEETEQLLEKTNMELEKERTTARQVQEAQEVEAAALRARIAELEAADSLKTSMNQQLEEENTELQALLRRAEEKAEQLEQQVREQQHNISIQGAQLTGLQESYSSQQELTATYKAQIDSMQEAHEATQSTMDDQLRLIGSQQAKIETLLKRADFQDSKVEQMEAGLLAEAQRRLAAEEESAKAKGEAEALKSQVAGAENVLMGAFDLWDRPVR